MSSDEILVKVEGVSKKYCRELRRSLRYGLQDVASEMLLRRKPSPELRRHEFWALQDVNFELKRGESFGIIGVNGSGKTTLLKIMQGLLKPTKGIVTLRGDVGALITLGQGFQPVLTGRENIFINAAILGIPKADVLERMDEILAFADLGEFIDAPVKTYSSGMKGRLGFAIATNLIVPDVLLLDEVLATGDWKFKERCFQRMEEIVSSGATIVFVSHLVPKVERLCNRVLLLNKGIVKALGPASEVCEEYYSMPDSYDGTAVRERRKKFLMAAKRSPDDEANGLNDEDYATYDEPDDLIEIHRIELLNQEGLPQEQFKTMDTITIRITFSSEQPFHHLKAVVQFLMMGDEITIAGFEHRFSPEEVAPEHSQRGVLDCIVPEIPMREGKYRVSVTISEVDDDSNSSPGKVSDLVRLTVKKNAELFHHQKLSPGIVYMPASWRFEARDGLEFYANGVSHGSLVEGVDDSQARTLPVGDRPHL